MIKYFKVQKIAAMTREPTTSEYVRFWVAKILVDSTTILFNLPEAVVKILAIIIELVADIFQEISNHLDFPTFKRWIHRFYIKAFVLGELLGLEKKK